MEIFHKLLNLFQAFQKEETQISRGKEVCLFRAVSADLDEYREVMEAPFEIPSESFKVSESALLTSVVLSTVRDSEHKESSVQIVVRRQSNGTQVAEQKYDGEALSGGYLRVHFSLPGRLQADEWYDVKIICKTGMYRASFQENLVEKDGISVQFNSTPVNASLFCALFLEV